MALKSNVLRSSSPTKMLVGIALKSPMRLDCLYTELLVVSKSNVDLLVCLDVARKRALILVYNTIDYIAIFKMYLNFGGSETL